MTNGQDISLIITIAVFPAIISIFVTLFVIRFSHPDDNAGLPPKIIAIICMSFSFTTLVAIPISCISTSDTIHIDDKLLFSIFSIVTVALIVTVIPFSIWFFQSIFVTAGSEYLKKRICHAITGVFVCLVVFLCLALPMYFTSKDQNLNVIDFCIGSVDFIGWFPFSIFFGIGMIALPVYLFCFWYYRPTPMVLEDYDNKRQVIGQRAQSLHESGEKMKDTLKNENFLMKRKTTNKFLQSVEAIKSDYIHLQTAFQFKGGNPILPWVYLVLSLFCIILSLLWIVQMAICVFIQPDEPIDIIGSILVAVTVDGFYVFSVSLYLLFSLYILTATVFGLLRVSSVVPFLFAGYKMETNNTYSDAFLVNAALMLLVSLPVAHFTTQTMVKFSSGSVVKGFFDEIEKSTLFKALFGGSVFYYTICGFAAISIILYFFFPPNMSKKTAKELDKIATY